MRTTASYNLFPDAPSERAMVRARYFAREGRTADAEAAYRAVLGDHPEFKTGWAEYFELLRRAGRPDDALRLAEAASAQFGDAAFPETLKGGALLDLGRYRDALSALERALAHDPDLAPAWHELGLAAHRLGDGNRALLALDRAFALEPHTETLKLRGRVLRDAGRYVAAEVSFEAAAQAAEHPEQRSEAEREVLATRRTAFYAPRRPGDLSAAERWFGVTGAVVLASAPGPVPPGDDTLVSALLELAHDRDWRFGQVVAVGPSLPQWSALAEGLGATLVGPAAFDATTVPLLVAPRPLPPDAGWAGLVARQAEAGAGLAFVLDHPVERAGPVEADVVGVLTEQGQRPPRMPAPAAALSQAQHPAARIVGRRLA